MRRRSKHFEKIAIGLQFEPEPTIFPLHTVTLTARVNLLTRLPRTPGAGVACPFTIPTTVYQLFINMKPNYVNQWH